MESATSDANDFTCKWQCGCLQVRGYCDSLLDWVEVRAVATKPALHFIDKKGLLAGVNLYIDEDEWLRWSRIGDNVLHIELRKWADAMLIVPLSANMLAKVAGGLCDTLPTCIVRAWDISKPTFVAPAMKIFMWTIPFALRHLTALEALGVTVVAPISKKQACGDIGNDAMAEPAFIDSALRLSILSDHVMQSLPAPSHTNLSTSNKHS